MFSTNFTDMVERISAGTSDKIFFIIFGKNDGAQADAMGGQQFFFYAADGQHSSAQCDFTGHGHVAACRNSSERADQSGGDGDAGRRAVFGDGTFGNVHVDINVAIEIGSEIRIARCASGYRPCRPARIPASRRQVFR